MKLSEGGRRTLAGWALLLALVTALFWGALRGLMIRWTDWDDGTYSHGLLVPAFALYLLYERRDDLRKSRMDGSLWGAALLAASVMALFAGKLGNMLFVQAAALIASLAALAVLVGGWSYFRVTALPTAYLIFMCPLPSAIYDKVSAQLRLLASTVSTSFLQLLSVSAYREGNLIYLPGNTLSVDDACSGIRSLFGIAATAAAFALLAPGGLLRKSFLILSTVPIAVFSNIMRVTGTGLLQYYGNEKLAQGFYHYLEGWVFYVLALGMLFGEYYLLKAIFPIDADKAAPGAADAGKTPDGEAAS